MSYETCGRVFVDKARAIGFARQTANTVGRDVWVFESESQLPVSFASPVPVIGSKNERQLNERTL
jgi:hypothetical protein